MHKNKSSVDEALAIIRERRPSGHINEIQKQFLIDFKKRFK